MDQKALQFGIGDQDRRPSGRDTPGGIGLVGGGAADVDEGLDINVHAFGLSPTFLQLAPMGTSESGGGGSRRVRGLTWGGIGEIGDPDCLIFLHKIIRSLRELGLVR